MRRAWSDSLVVLGGTMMGEVGDKIEQWMEVMDGNEGEVFMKWEAILGEKYIGGAVKLWRVIAH